MLLLAQPAVTVVLATPVLLALAAVGAWILRCKDENRRVRVVGALLLLVGFGGTTLMFVGFIRWKNAWNGLDIRPEVADADVVGVWFKDDATIRFLPDHTFRLMDHDELRGTWELNMS